VLQCADLGQLIDVGVACCSVPT